MESQLSFAFLNEKIHSDWDEHLLLISHNIKLSKKVIKEKEEVSTICDKKGIYSPPHITVSKLHIKRGSEKQVFALLQEIFSKHERFAIELEDFGSFEHPNFTCTIYIKVKEHHPFLKLANDLRAARKVLQALNCRIEFLVNKPHLSLVRGLPYRNYKTAMPIYSNRAFKDAFVAKEIVLSKRRIKCDGFNKVSLRLSPYNSLLK